MDSNARSLLSPLLVSLAPTDLGLMFQLIAAVMRIAFLAAVNHDNRTRMWTS